MCWIGAYHTDQSVILLELFYDRFISPTQDTSPYSGTVGYRLSRSEEITQSIQAIFHVSVSFSIKLPERNTERRNLDLTTNASSNGLAFRTHASALFQSAAETRVS